ncbi:MULTISPECIES: adenosylcobinamide-GDP ribazoletransferase [Rhodomicrobium]|uniref:adenosylcobinamide-GDP ribazoletransferase n=1 Tax=Rhodomicrobium TaxID=1068 RepID=UPI000B4AC5DC|nr:MULTISPECIES: adenosylcobinamide-GDP ribazoletransferase [Rhodomicrobium]
MSGPLAGPARRRAEELGLAIGLLTRYPLPRFPTRSAATIGSAFWAYPLAGALIGIPAAIVLWLSVSAGFSATAAALLAMTAALIAGGGFHEDGLSDFWDGLGGGYEREEKLEIMRDSRIGTFGALALMLALGLQASFLVSLQHYAGLAAVMAAMIAAETVARGAIALPVAYLDPARSDGLGASMGTLRQGALLGGIALAIVIPVLLLGTLAVALIVGALLGAGSVVLLAWYFLGGFTGDVLGASAVTARLAALAALTLAMTP